MNQHNEDPPNFPPPAYTAVATSSSRPPPAIAPPTTQVTEEPPPYDLAPPGLSYEYSTGANATRDEAENAAAWCHAYPLTPAVPLNGEQIQAIHSHYHTLLAPPQGLKGKFSLSNPSCRAWRVETQSGTTDTLLQTVLPAYASLADSPLNTERTKTIYFEVRIIRLGARKDPKSKISGLLSSRARHEESGVALGFFAPPYPPFRLPGWERGSLAVHSDDGRRYVGNNEGGMDFTAPFKEGETVGLGMTFSVAEYSKTGAKIDTNIFLTRDGRRAHGWNLMKESDAQDENIWGLMGDKDLFPAIGIFGPVEVEVVFGESGWLYRGWNSNVG